MSDKIAGPGDNMSDELYFSMARHLQEGGIQAGDPLPSEGELGEVLGVGRQRVREALGVLEAFGLVASRQGARRTWRGLRADDFAARGARLFQGSASGVPEMLEVRHALETSLLPAVMPRFTAADVQRLRLLADEMLELAERGEHFYVQDEAFHRGLLAPLNNGVVDAFLHSFWAAFSAIVDEDEAAEDPVIAAMHGRIVDAIEAGDARRAVHELDAHFYGVRNRFPDIAFEATSPFAP